jgi:hypothetical protein
MKNSKKYLSIPLTIVFFGFLSAQATHAADSLIKFSDGDIVSAEKVNDNFDFVNNKSFNKQGNDLYFNSGRVGLGTSYPNYTLDINGNINVTGNFYKNGNLLLSSSSESSFKVGQYANSVNNFPFSITTNLGKRPKKVKITMSANGMFFKSEWFDPDQDGSGVLMMFHKIYDDEIDDRCLDDTSEIGRLQKSLNDAQDFEISTTNNSITISKGTTWGNPDLVGLSTVTWYVE